MFHTSQYTISTPIGCQLFKHTMDAMVHAKDTRDA